MTLKLAISGFGRIGRMTLRAFQEMGHQDMEIVLINSPGPVETSAHLYEFDSVHGRAVGMVTHGEDWMDVGSGKIHMSRERDPANIPHAAHCVDMFWNVRENSTTAKHQPRILPLARKKCLCRHHAKTLTKPLFLGSMTAC